MSDSVTRPATCSPMVSTGIHCVHETTPDSGEWRCCWYSICGFSSRTRADGRIPVLEDGKEP